MNLFLALSLLTITPGPAVPDTVYSGSISLPQYTAQCARPFATGLNDSVSLGFSSSESVRCAIVEAPDLASACEKFENGNALAGAVEKSPRLWYTGLARGGRLWLFILRYECFGWREHGMKIDVVVMRP